MNLVGDIQRAFSEREYPGDAHVLLPVDDEGEGGLFIGTTWPELDSAQLELRTFVLHCFTAAGFCYFLPAYLIASIRAPMTGLPDSIIDRVCPPKNDINRRSFVEWWSFLSHPQRRAILDIVRYHVGRGAVVRPGAIEALERACET